MPFKDLDILLGDALDKAYKRYCKDNPTLSNWDRTTVRDILDLYREILGHAFNTFFSNSGNNNL